MAWNVYRFKESKKSSEYDEFEEAIDMMKDGMNILCDLAEEMEHLYGERKGYMRKEHEGGSEEKYDFRRRMMNRGGSGGGGGSK